MRLLPPYQLETSRVEVVTDWSAPPCAQHPRLSIAGEEGDLHQDRFKRGDSARKERHILDTLNEQLDPLTSWIVDRAADAIESPRRDLPKVRIPARLSRSAWLLSERLGRRAGGAGPYTAGVRLLQQGRWKAASIAFADAVEAFEREVGHDHMWTAHALARQGWCYLVLGRADEAVSRCEDALQVVLRLKPDDKQQVDYFKAVVGAAHKNAFGS